MCTCVPRCDILRPDWSVDARRNGGLCQRSKDRVGGNLFRDGADCGVLGLHRDGRLGAFFVAGGLLATGDRECECKRNAGESGPAKRDVTLGSHSG